jgi:predicted metal-dependent phosphotriesterase family hydrolase
VPVRERPVLKCACVFERARAILFDLIGQERSGLTGELIGVHPKVQVASVKGYLDRGLASQMLLSQNVNHVQLLTVDGGDGYAHIARNVVARLRDYHVTEEQLGALLVDNPRRLLAPIS